MILTALCLSLGLAAAQDRPPERPADPRVGAVPAPAPAPAEPAPAFGPPAPPAWWPLRGTDTDEAACRSALSALGAVFQARPPITDPEDRDCGMARPLRVERILPDLALKGGAVMRCDTALALAGWARDFVQPAAARLPGAPRVTGLHLGTTYDCRPRVGTGQAMPRLSEHALGNAIDISAVVLSDGDVLPIQPRADTGDLAEGFQRTIRASACLFFATVLGPGSNAAHDDHLHLDIAARAGGWRLCQ